MFFRLLKNYLDNFIEDVFHLTKKTKINSLGRLLIKIFVYFFIILLQKMFDNVYQIKPLKLCNKKCIKI